MKGVDCSRPTETNNGGFVQRWNRMKNQTIEMYGRIHSDICNVPLYLLSGVKIQIKLTKAKRAFFLSNIADSKVIFQFEEARLYVKRIRLNPTMLAFHNEALLERLSCKIQFYQSRTQDIHVC